MRARKHPMPARPTSSTFGGGSSPSSFDAFYDWALARGARPVKCAPAEVTEGWRGVVATDSIDAGEVVLAVPGELLMSRRSAMSDPTLAAVLEGPEGEALSPTERLCVHLLHEASKGAGSRWHPYISQLPRRYNLMGTWRRAEREMLQVPFAIAEAERCAAEMERSWRRAMPALEALGVPVGFRALGAWGWARSGVSSRTVFVPYDAAGALCPVGDLFNYAPPPPPHVPAVLGSPLGPVDPGGGGQGPTAARGDRGDARADGTEDACAPAGEAGDGAWEEAAGEYRFYARRKHEPGEQIMLCYGRHSNLSLLEHYGFMLPYVNPHDVAPLPGPLVSGGRGRTNAPRAPSGLDLAAFEAGPVASPDGGDTNRRSRRRVVVRVPGPSFIDATRG